MGSIDDLAGMFADAPAPASLGTLAQEAARARDELDHAHALYEGLQQSLMEEVERKLDGLKREREAAEAKFEALTSQLLDVMTKEKVDAVPLPDRAPVFLKVVPGRKKQPTKGFLTEQLGKATADVIWSRLPASPDTTTVVVPSKIDTPPSA